MLFLIYGENDFLIFEKKKWFRRSIFQSTQKAEIKNFDFSENNWQDFLDIFKSQSMFSAKKLIFVSNLSQAKFEDEFKAFLREKYDTLNRDKDVWVIFVEEEAKNKIISSLIRKGVKKYEFLKFSFKNRQKFIEHFTNYAKTLNVTIQPEALTLLGEFFDYNGWLVKNEIKKLAFISKGEKIDKELVKKYCLPKYLSNEVFDLSEKIFQKDKKGAILILKKLSFWGEDEGKIFNMLLWQIKNFVKIKYLADKELKFKPFYVNKARRLINKFSLAELQYIYKILANTDLKIKTSRLTYREALLDLFRKI